MVTVHFQTFGNWMDVAIQHLALAIVVEKYECLSLFSYYYYLLIQL
jgi:hypothetical protein